MIFFYFILFIYLFIDFFFLGGGVYVNFLAKLVILKLSMIALLSLIAVFVVVFSLVNYFRTTLHVSNSLELDKARQTTGGKQWN